MQQLQLALKQLGALQNIPTPGVIGGAAGPGNTSLAAVPSTYEAAIGGHEGTGKNPASSATGTGQFLDSTYLAFAKANPQLFTGMDDKAILATRSDPALGPKLGTMAIGWLAQQNAPTLQAAGVAPSGQSLGMAHYLGAGPAAAVMKAADNAPVAGLVSQAALDANPELRSMTAGQMRARYAAMPDPGFLRPAAAAAAAPPGAAPVGVQFSGPGAPTAPAPGGPAAAAGVARGMVGAGADPATLAPGAAPVPPIPPAVPPAAQGFVYKPPTDLTPAERVQFDPNLPPDVLENYRTAIQHAPTPEAALKARQDLAQAQAKQRQDAASNVEKDREKQLTAWQATKSTATDEQLQARGITRTPGVDYQIDNNGTLSMVQDPAAAKQQDNDHALKMAEAQQQVSAGRGGGQGIVRGRSGAADHGIPGGGGRGAAQQPAAADEDGDPAGADRHAGDRDGEISGHHWRAEGHRGRQS